MSEQRGGSMNGKVHDYIKLGYLTIVLSVLVYFTQGILLNADIISNRITFIQVDVSLWLFFLGLLVLAKGRKQIVLDKIVSGESANLRNKTKKRDKTKKNDVNSKTEKEDVHFSYELYRIVFLSLLLSTFVGIMIEAPEKSLDLSMLAPEYLSLFFPVIIGILIYREAYIFRNRFERRSQILAYCIIFTLSITILSLYYEIVPILMKAKSYQDFVALYAKNAISYPISITILCALYPWFYESLSIKHSNIRHFPLFFAFLFYLLLALVNLEKLLGIHVVIIFWSIYFVIFIIIRVVTNHRPAYEKEWREKLRKAKLLK